MVQWGEQIGTNTARLIERILSEKPHPEMRYRSCLGIIRLAERYSATRMEAAAQRALESNACRFKSVELSEAVDASDLKSRNPRCCSVVPSEVGFRRFSTVDSPARTAHGAFFCCKLQ
jgi:hypothetical protein